MGATTFASPMPSEQHELVRAMLAKLPEFSERLATLVAEADELYRHVDNVAPEELRQVCRANLERALTSFIEGRGPALDAVRKTGLAQARRGIPLSAGLRAFRICGAFVYETLLGQAGARNITSAQTVELSSSVWKTIDLYSDALATAYTDVAREDSREQARTRLHLLDSLLRGPLSNQVEVEDAIRALGLPTTGTFVVAVAERLTPERGRADPDAVEVLLRARRWRSVWLPSGDAEVGIVVVDRTEDVYRLREVLGSQPIAVGMSRPFTALSEIAAATLRARVARRALPSGTTGVVVFGDAPVATLVASAPALGREVVRTVLSGVLELGRPERKVLLDTLFAWFAGHGSAKETADRLFVHPNTVRYRLRRGQDLTKRDLTNPADVGELYVALESVRLEAEPE
ncbi:MAG: helix-turn-helix domain-containing protein [Actinomycetota bacterium]|nr:helix-turn-helix domain-containing protein [Actinomycetota bacterium]